MAMPEPAFVTCIRLPQIGRDLKHLRRKYKNVDKHVEYAENLLTKRYQDPQAEPYPGFGQQHRIFKTRIINTDLGKGISSGYRLIYELLQPTQQKQETALLIYIYPKHGHDDETRIKAEIQTRLGSTEYQQLTKGHA